MFRNVYETNGAVIIRDIESFNAKVVKARNSERSSTFTYHFKT